MKRQFLATIALLIIIELINVEYVENCKTNVIYFPSLKASAIAIMKGLSNGGPVRGTITFQQEALTEALKISINISGVLSSSKKHGLFIYNDGIQDSSDDVTIKCGSAGSHFNPLKSNHGNINNSVRHIGDYGNVVSDQNGIISAEITDHFSQLYGPFGIIGRTIVLHRNEDDFSENSNTGTIIACGVIGVSNTKTV